MGKILQDKKNMLPIYSIIERYLSLIVPQRDKFHLRQEDKQVHFRQAKRILKEIIENR
jgi:hypothetical protein